MYQQHNRDDQLSTEPSMPQGRVVPLDLAELKIVSQSIGEDGSLEVHVKATTDRETCPSCKKICVKIHDTRPRAKRDIALRTYQVRLIIEKRRFGCTTCQKTFTEPDSVCGRYTHEMCNEMKTSRQ